MIVTTLQAVRYVSSKGFPDQEGLALARTIIKMKADIDWNDFTVDLRFVPSRIQISSFFNTFFQTMYDEDPELFKLSRGIKWSTDFQFQADNINRYVSKFRPRVKKVTT